MPVLTTTRGRLVEVLTRAEGDRLRAENAELRKRIRLAQAALDVRAEPEDRYGRLLVLLDLRRPLPKRGR